MKIFDSLASVASVEPPTWGSKLAGVKAQKRQPKHKQMAQLMERTQTERPRVVVVRRGMPPRRSTPHRDRALQELDVLLNARDREAWKLRPLSGLRPRCNPRQHFRARKPADAGDGDAHGPRRGAQEGRDVRGVLVRAQAGAQEAELEGHARARVRGHGDPERGEGGEGLVPKTHFEWRREPKGSQNCSESL